jgi:hypothetical protein
MPFDGNSPNTKAVEMIDALLCHYAMNRNHISSIDLAATIRLLRSRLNMQNTNARKYILKAAEVPTCYSLSFADLDRMIADYDGLENILLRARDLANGEPMRPLTWTPRTQGCEYTLERACLLTDNCLPLRWAR